MTSTCMEAQAQKERERAEVRMEGQALGRVWEHPVGPAKDYKERKKEKVGPLGLKNGSFFFS